MMKQTNHSPYQHPIAANDRASLLTAALETVVISSSRITIIFFFVACGWFPVPAEGRENRPEECASVADSCHSRVSGMRVLLQRGVAAAKGRGGKPCTPPLSLFLIYHSSLVSLSSYQALSDFLFSTLSPQTHINNSSYHADPSTSNAPFPSWGSDALLLIVCHFLDFLLPLLSFQLYQLVLFYLGQRK